MRVLVIEDYDPVREAVSQHLREAGFAVDESGDGEEGLWYAEGHDYDVIVLDLMLPSISGETILQRLQENRTDARILVLTAKHDVESRVRGLNAGADDYLIKPFSLDELLARVHVLVRRRYQQSSTTLVVGDLRIDSVGQSVSRAGVEVELTKREYSLLYLLASRAGQVVSRTEIWESLYDFASDSHSNVVDVYIRYLRQKLERPEWPILIHTRRGFGYMLKEQRASA